MSLQEWLRNGWLTSHQTGREELSELLAVVERDLNDATTPNLSADWRLNIAYNAALQAATAALAAAGFHAPREAHHFRVIYSLQYTLGCDSTLITEFDQFRKKRNIGEYERAGTISEHEADEMLALAKQLVDQVTQWLQENHSELL